MPSPITDPVLAALLAFDTVVGDQQPPDLPLRLAAMRAALDAAARAHLSEMLPELETDQNGL